MDEKGGPVNDVDRACRSHDLAYSVARSDDDIWNADDHLLRDVKNASTIVYPLFKFFFTAKYLYELQFGSPYKPTLKFSIQTNAEGNSKLNYAEDEVEVDYNVKDPWFREYDHAWRKSLTDIWQGSCQIMDKIPAQNVLDVTSHCEQAGSTGSHISPAPAEEEIDLEMQCDPGIGAWVIPEPPTKYGKCRIVINEFNIAWMNNVFLELAKLCPPGVRGAFNLLAGYIIIIFTGGRNPEIVFSSDLRDYQMQEVLSPNTAKPRTKSFFVLGTERVHGVDKTLFTSSSVGGTDKFVPTPDQTYGLALLFIPGRKDRVNKEKEAVLLRSIGGRAQGKQILSNREFYTQILRTRTQDIVFFGKECSENSCDYFKDVFKAFDETEVFGKPETPTSDSSETISWNLCEGLLPMQRQFFQVNSATPKQDNICNNAESTEQVSKLKPPFSFMGVRELDCKEQRSN